MSPIQLLRLRLIAYLLTSLALILIYLGLTPERRQR